MITRLCLLAAIALALLAPLDSFAQVSNGPFGGLFGRTPEREGREFTAIEFRTSGGGQFDDGLFLDDSVDAEGDRLKGGYTSGANAALALGRRTAKTEIDLSSTVSYMNYFEPRSFGATSVQAGGTLRGKPTTRLTIDSAAYFSRQPFFQMLPPVLGQSPDWVVPVATNPFAVRLLLHDSIDGQLGFTHKPTRRASVSAYVTGRQVRFNDQPAADFDMVGGQVGGRYQLNRDFALRLAYGREDYRTRKVEDADRYVHEYLDLGVDFLKDISIARRTSLGIATQTSMLREGGARRKYRVNGNVALTRWFQRTWHASIAAQRNTDFLPGFFEPLFSDMINTSIGGMLGARTEWFALAGGGLGQFGFDPHEGRFRTVTATSRLNVGLSRRIGTYIQYSYYHYELPPSAESIALLGQLSRQSVVVGLNVWVPIYSQVRAPRGPQ